MVWRIPTPSKHVLVSNPAREMGSGFGTLYTVCSQGVVAAWTRIYSYRLPRTNSFDSTHHGLKPSHEPSPTAIAKLCSFIVITSRAGSYGPQGQPEPELEPHVPSRITGYPPALSTHQPTNWGSYNPLENSHARHHMGLESASSLRPSNGCSLGPSPSAHCMLHSLYRALCTR